MSTMQKVLLGIALSTVLICSAAGIYGYLRVWPRIPGIFSGALESEISSEIEASIGPRVSAMGSTSGQLLISEQDLDFNTLVDDSGDSGVDVTNGEATIYNSVLTVGPNGIDVSLAGVQLHAVPAITHGQFDLIELESTGGLAGKLIDPHAIEQGIESGINAALAQAPQKPQSVVTSEGYLTIFFGPEPENPLCGSGGLGCETETPAFSSAPIPAHE